MCSRLFEAVRFWIFVVALATKCRAFVGHTAFVRNPRVVDGLQPTPSKEQSLLSPIIPFPGKNNNNVVHSKSPGLMKLAATRPSSSSSSFPLTRTQQRRRRTLLQTNGSHFALDRFSGRTEFGSTFDLVTRFPHNSNDSLIAQWLLNSERVAMSIWDKELIKNKGNAVFELQIMTLRFVTITLKPSVDVKAWTSTNEESTEGPVFYLQSVGFDPNIQILPGIGLDAKALGIEIEVVGQMQPTNGGVTGQMAFRTKGLLPPPLRILPESSLKAASKVIVDTITKFAIASFQKSAVANFQEFVTEQQDAS